MGASAPPGRGILSNLVRPAVPSVWASNPRLAYPMRMGNFTPLQPPLCAIKHAATQPPAQAHRGQGPAGTEGQLLHLLKTQVRKQRIQVDLSIFCQLASVLTNLQQCEATFLKERK